MAAEPSRPRRLELSLQRLCRFIPELLLLQSSLGLVAWLKLHVLTHPHRHIQQSTHIHNSPIRQREDGGGSIRSVCHLASWMSYHTFNQALDLGRQHIVRRHHPQITAQTPTPRGASPPPLGFISSTSAGTVAVFFHAAEEHLISCRNHFHCLLSIFLTHPELQPHCYSWFNVWISFLENK